MYIDLLVLIVGLIIVLMFFKRFSSFVFFMAIIEIFLRILAFIKNNIGLDDVAAIIGKYLFIKYYIKMVLCWYYGYILIVYSKNIFKKEKDLKKRFLGISFCYSVF